PGGAAQVDRRGSVRNSWRAGRLMAARPRTRSLPWWGVSPHHGRLRVFPPWGVRSGLGGFHGAAAGMATCPAGGRERARPRGLTARRRHPDLVGTVDVGEPAFRVDLDPGDG